MTFGAPWLLALLLVLPAVAAVYVLFQRRRPRYTVRFTNLSLLASVAPRQAAWRRHVPPVLYAVALGALVVSLARPFATVLTPKQQGTVMLVIDVSGSMDSTDVKPTRLRAAVQEAERFVSQLPGSFRVGVVSFSSTAQVLATPTADRNITKRALESMRAVGGTAMGDGIERALDFAKQAPTNDVQRGAPSTQPKGAPSASPAPAAAPAAQGNGATEIILLSDGASNAGRVEPQAAAGDAAQLGVPIYAIALGTPNGTLDQQVGRTIRRIPVPPDPATLQQVAQISGGKSFEAPSDSDLHGIYSSLASKIGFEPSNEDITPLFVGAAAILLVVGGALSTFWFHRFP